MDAGRMRRVVAIAGAIAGLASAAAAQPPEPQSREAVVEEAQVARIPNLRPYGRSTGERLMDKAENILNGTPTWHPFFGSAYRGGGFALGVGYLQHVSSFNFVDVRGSYSVSNYKRAEAEFVAPRLFHRRGELSVLGGWRDAPETHFYGVGTDTTIEDRAFFGFRESHGSALLTLRPTRRLLMLRGGLELARWSLDGGTGSTPSVDNAFTPTTLPGLGTTTTYLHTQATAGFDWRPSPGYARRGGFYRVTAHDYHDRDSQFGFRQVDYEVIQHLPILREAWTLSLRGIARTTALKDDQQVPFFLLPSLGGGDDLRGFSSWRFRDRNSLLVQGEWRIMANRYLDTAVFFDAGKVAAHTSDLGFHGLKSDYGFGARFHTPIATPLRIEYARSNEGGRLIVAVSPVF
jgi:hypothetical protein